MVPIYRNSECLDINGLCRMYCLSTLESPFFNYELPGIQLSYLPSLVAEFYLNIKLLFLDPIAGEMFHLIYFRSNWIPSLLFFPVFFSVLVYFVFVFVLFCFCLLVCLFVCLFFLNDVMLYLFHDKFYTPIFWKFMCQKGHQQNYNLNLSFKYRASKKNAIIGWELYLKNKKISCTNNVNF